MTIKPTDGPKRQIQIKPTYEYAVLTKDNDGKIVIQYVPISPIRQMFKQGIIKEMDNDLNDNLLKMEEHHGNRKGLRTHDIIWLPATKRHEEGYFLVLKLSTDHSTHKEVIYVTPENKVKVKSKNSNEPTNSPTKSDKKPKEKAKEIALNNKDLLNIYNNPTFMLVK